MRLVTGEAEPAEEPVDGEVVEVEGDEAIADQLFAETAETPRQEDVG